MLIAYTVATQLIHSLRPIVETLALVDRSLADQVRRAGSSVLLTIAEGERRTGRDRAHLFRVAAGSAAEVRAALEVGTAWAYLSEDSVSEPRRLIDRVLGLLWGLTHPRR